MCEKNKKICASASVFHCSFFFSSLWHFLTLVAHVFHIPRMRTPLPLSHTHAHTPLTHTHTSPKEPDQTKSQTWQHICESKNYPPVRQNNNFHNSGAAILPCAICELRAYIVVNTHRSMHLIPGQQGSRNVFLSSECALFRKGSSPISCIRCQCRIIQGFFISWRYR